MNDASIPPGDAAPDEGSLGLPRRGDAVPRDAGTVLLTRAEHFVVARETLTTFAEGVRETRSHVASRNVLEIRERALHEIRTLSEPLESADTSIDVQAIVVPLSRERAVVVKATVTEEYVEVSKVRIRDTIAVRGELRHEVVSTESDAS